VSAVFVPHFNDGFLPTPFREEIDDRMRANMQDEEKYREAMAKKEREHTEEERRLAHVAITRCAIMT
jgi:superfamily I DNA/RNA helicase